MVDYGLCITASPCNHDTSNMLLELYLFYVF